MRNYIMSKKQKKSVDLGNQGNASIKGFYGTITDESTSDICEWIIGSNYMPVGSDVERPSKLVLIINSDGGELPATFSVIELMKSSIIPIQTIALGKVASGGLMMFMAGTPGQRVFTPSCSIMSHIYSTELGGSHSEIFNVHKELMNVYERMLNHYIRYTGKSEKYIKEFLLTKTDEWLTPEKAVQHGLGDIVSDNLNFLYNI